MSIHIGADPWIGCGNLHNLSLGLIYSLNRSGVATIAQIGDLLNTTIYQKYWLSEEALDIPEQWHMEWRRNVAALIESYVRLRNVDDEMIWALAQKGTYTPKEGYPIIHACHKPLSL